jgi:hypothetical protein
VWRTFALDEDEDSEIAVRTPAREKGARNAVDAGHAGEVAGAQVPRDLDARQWLMSDSPESDVRRQFETPQQMVSRPLRWPQRKYINAQNRR